MRARRRALAVARELDDVDGFRAATAEVDGFRGAESCSGPWSTRCCTSVRTIATTSTSGDSAGSAATRVAGVGVGSGRGGSGVAGWRWESREARRMCVRPADWCG